MNANTDDHYREMDTVRLLNEVSRVSTARQALDAGATARLALLMPIALGALVLAWLFPYEAPPIVKFMLIIGSCGAMAALIEIWSMSRRLEAAIELVKLCETELRTRTPTSQSNVP